MNGIFPIACTIFGHRLVDGLHSIENSRLETAIFD